jgi:hypothetical protein
MHRRLEIFYEELVNGFIFLSLWNEHIVNAMAVLEGLGGSRHTARARIRKRAIRQE